MKARLITGLEFERDVFDLVLTPFVYRRYLDYGVFDALRQMKTLIAKEVARKDMAENIKLGPGGIREIEFIVQAFQLVRGGRSRELRTRSLLEALPRLVGDRQLPQRRCGAARRGVSVPPHARESPPGDGRPADSRAARATTSSARVSRTRSANKIGATCTTRLASQRASSRHSSSASRGTPKAAARGRDGSDLAGSAWAEGAPGTALAGTPLEGDAEVAALLTELRGGGLYQRMDEVARQRLAAVVGRTIALIGKHETPKKALERVLPIYRAVCRRSAYLVVAQREPGGTRALAEPRRAERVDREANRGATDAARRVARRARVRHAADARGASGPARPGAARRRARRRRGTARGHPDLPAHGDFQDCDRRSTRALCR